MSSILISISVIVGLILAVGLMSLSESALVTARRWRLRERAARGERGHTLVAGELSKAQLCKALCDITVGAPGTHERVA